MNKKKNKGGYVRDDGGSDIGPNIGTAWLVLSHGTWFAASISAISLALTETHGSAVSITWACIALVLQIWTFYAIETTRKASDKIGTAIFGPEAFILLNIMNFLTMGVTIWSLVAIIVL